MFSFLERSLNQNFVKIFQPVTDKREKNEMQSLGKVTNWTEL